MGNAKYGMPYQGSKTRIADELIAVLPPARHFYDCFGGGRCHVARRRTVREV